MAIEGNVDQNAGAEGVKPAGSTTVDAGKPAGSTTVGTTVTGQEGQAQKPTGFTYQEDRSKWIPPHRLTEVSTKAQQAESRAQQLQTQLQALVGATPADPKTQEAETIKAQFFELFPGMKSLAQLSPEQLQQLLDAPKQVGAANEFVSRSWQRHGKQQLTSLVAAVSDAVGSDLSDRAQGRLKAAFTDTIEREAQKAQETGEISDLFQRYIDGDETLVEEFAKEWAEDYFVPARRTVASQEIRRTTHKVPNSTGRGQVTTAPRQEFKTLDERLDYAAKLYKERGGQFGSGS